MRIKNKISLLIIGILICMNALAQADLNQVVKLGSPNDEWPMDIMFGHDNDIILTGSLVLPSNDINSFVYVLDSTGNVEKSHIFNCSEYSNFTLLKSFKESNGYVFAGTKSKETPSFNQKLFMYFSTKNLVLTDSILIDFSNSLRIKGVKVKRFDSTLFWHGFAEDLVNQTFTPFVLSTDMNGNVICRHIGDYAEFTGLFNYALVKDIRNGGYLLFDYWKATDLDYYAILINDSLELEIDGHIKLADSIIYSGVQIKMDQIYEAEHFNSQLVYVGRGGIAGEDYYVAITDSVSRTQYYRKFSGRDDYFLLAEKPLAVNSTHIFVSFADSIMSYKPRYSSLTNKITVAKLDTVLNTVWERRLGWDAYFFQQDIVATADGGCLVLGSVYDKDTMNQQHDIVLFKLDANGNVTGTHRIENPGVSVLNAYPNPGKDHFYVEGVNGSALQVYSLNGKILLEQQLNTGRNKVEMVKYPSGVYLLRLSDEKGRLLASGKWIKQ